MTPLSPPSGFMLNSEPSGRRMSVNYLLLIGGESLAKLCTLGAFVYLARTLDLGVYGSVEWVLATMVFFTLPVDFGIGVYGARELARAPHRASTLLRDVATMRLTLVSISFTLLLILVALLPGTADVKLLLILYGVSLFAEPVLADWFFQAHDRMHWVALTALTRRGAFAFLVLLFVRPHTPLFLIGLCECGSAFAMAILCLAILRRRLGFTMPRPANPLSVLRTHLPHAAPIGLSHLAWALQWYCATVLMGLLASGDELAWFGASHRIIMALHTFVYLYFFNLLPSLARGAGRSIEHVQKLVSRSLGWTAWAGIAGALAISMVGGDLLTVVFGSKYAGVHGPLAVLGWLIPAALINGHYRYMLIACNQQGLEFRCTAISAATALGLAAVLIPRYGAIGAASAIVASSLVNLGLAFAYVNSRIARLPFLRQMVLPLATGIIVITCFASLAQAGPWPAAALAGMTYLAVFMIWVGWNFLRGEFVVAPVSNAVRL